MATITVKNIPDELYEQLKQSAVMHRRSMNSEIIFWLERVLGKPTIDVDATLAKARVLREQAKVYIASQDELDTLMDEGRP
jgi:antitoxin FitA